MSARYDCSGMTVGPRSRWVGCWYVTRCRCGSDITHLPDATGLILEVNLDSVDVDRDDPRHGVVEHHEVHTCPHTPVRDGHGRRTAILPAITTATQRLALPEPTDEREPTGDDADRQIDLLNRLAAEAAEADHDQHLARRRGQPGESR